MLKLQRYRPGDAADMSLIEFVARCVNSGVRVLQDGMGRVMLVGSAGWHILILADVVFIH